MRRDKKRNKIIIFILIGIVCMMGVGYAAFQTQLDIKGNTEISSEWNIKIISAEVSDTGGSGENVKNTYTDLTANLEANLYSKGDYVEYNVIVENAGTFDAKLDTLGITNSNNEAVKITSTGLVKGQSLYKGETATLTVRIEYNPNYEGDASGTSGETTIDLGFVQNSEGTIEPTVDHLVTYDYTTNGGESTTAEDEYVAEGESINLSYTATKTNYEFKGWNTNAQAAEGLTDLTMGTEDITLYAIFEAIDTTPPVIESINTSATTNSITAVVIANDEESGISKYEFSIDGGKTWIDNGVSNTYTFTGLKQGTSYNIQVRVTNGVNLTAEKETSKGIDLINGIVNEGDGLYPDDYEEGRYVYKGTEPDNYVWFNNELWRIVSLESDGTMKIIRNNSLETEMSWDNNSSNDWNEASLNTYLNGDYYDSLTSVAQSQIESHNWSIGEITDGNNDLNAQIDEENKTTSNGDIGLIALSDFLRANNNMEQCGTYSLNNGNVETCEKTNWLVNSTDFAWTITTSNGSKVVYVIANGLIDNYGPNGKSSVKPSVYLKDSVKIMGGSGTSDDPYQLGNSVSTSKVPGATFSQYTEAGKIIVAVHFPEGCGDKYTCTYTDEAGEEHEWKSEVAEVEFTDEGVITATVSDGTNEVTSSYTVVWQREADLEYTGDVQTYTAPADGYYKVELWGGQSGTGSETVANGKGSYTSGEIYLEKGTNLYFYVGSTGDDSEVCRKTAFFNNGGIVTDNGNGKCGATGGGATDVRLVSGEWNDVTSLRSRIMVAASGSFRTDGGDLIGQEYYDSTDEYYPYIGKKATQTSGGVAPTKYSVAISNGTAGGFGYAGNGGASASSTRTGGGATGGSGYYGGSGASGLANGTFAGGSGSSYISGYAGVNSITSETSETHTNQTNHYSGKYFINTDMIAGNNGGDGKAKITYIDDPSSPDSSKIKRVRYIKDCTNGTTHDETNQWLEIQAISYGVNVAKGATVTSTSPAEDGRDVSYIVDGIMDDTTKFFQPVNDGKQCVIVDLGKEYDLEEIGVWHYYVDRSSNNNVTSVAGENEIYREVYNDGSYTDSSKGNHITKDITQPQFKEEKNITTDVDILFPGGCGEDYICSYIKDGGEEITVTESTKVSFTDSGTLVAKIKHPSGKVVASAYTVHRNSLYVSNSGNDSTGLGTKEKPYKTLNKAYDEADYISTIYVMDDLTVNSEMTLDEDKNINLTSYSETGEANSIIRATNSNSNIINQTNGSLRLEDIIIDGNNVETNHALIVVDASLLIEEGAIIQNGININEGETDEIGGAIAGIGGTITINGGIIKNNTAKDGGAIYLRQDATMTIDGANITNNTATSSNGGLYIEKGNTYTYNSGVICNNTPTNGYERCS